MRKDETRNRRELFLDTTFVLPFFQVPISVDAFDLSEFETFIGDLERAHLAELSIYEAKAKLTRLSRVHRGYAHALQAFGRNLSVLRADNRFVFHSYTNDADEHFNQFIAVTRQLNAFDLLILSQAFLVGELLTEDQDLLNLRNSERFVESPLSQSIKIRRWKEMVSKRRQH